MSLFTKKGEAAVEATNENGGANESPIVSFKSGTTLKVGVKSINDVAEYFGYSIYKKVNTFVPKNPASRNNRGYVTGNLTVWDRAADLLYKDADAAKKAGAGETDVKKITDEAYLYSGKRRFLRAFYDLTTGKDIVVDLSPKQETVIKSVIADNIDDLDAIAFKLTKKGEGTNAVVALSAIVKMERDLTEEERANFAKITEAPFDMDSFETCLYVADEAEQIKNLVIAGFDIARLGLSIGATTQPSTQSPTQPAANTPPDADAPESAEPKLNF